MGYTHYFEPRSGFSKAWNRNWRRAKFWFERIVEEKYPNLLKESYESEKPPLFSKILISFNGRDHSVGHEDFWLVPKTKARGEFCKTEGKKYDIMVCAALMIVQAYTDSLHVTSDGLYTMTYDKKELMSLYGGKTEAVSSDLWMNARNLVREYGFLPTFYGYSYSDYSTEEKEEYRVNYSLSTVHTPEETSYMKIFAAESEKSLFGES